MKITKTNKMKNRFKHLFASILVLGFVFASSANVWAQCDTRVMKPLIDQLLKECKKEGESDASECTEKQATLTKVVRTLNNLVGNGSLRVGPRVIEFGKNQNGTIIPPGDRTFVSGAPLEKDRAKLEFTYQGGKAKVDVSVCKIDAEGRATKLTSFILDGKNLSSGNKVTKNLSAVKGDFLQVFLDGKQPVGSRFKFIFKATQN